MRKQVLTLFVLFCFSTSAISQSFCETSAYSPYKDFLLNAEGDWSEYSFCVTIYIHVIRRSDGTGGQSFANVTDAVGYLDDAFNPYNIHFISDYNIHYINDTTLFNTPSKIFLIDQYDHDVWSGYIFI